MFLISEWGVSRTGYLIPGRVGILAWPWARVLPSPSSPPSSLSSPSRVYYRTPNRSTEFTTGHETGVRVYYRTHSGVRVYCRIPNRNTEFTTGHQTGVRVYYRTPLRSQSLLQDTTCSSRIHQKLIKIIQNINNNATFENVFEIGPHARP